MRQIIFDASGNNLKMEIITPMVQSKSNDPIQIIGLGSSGVNITKYLCSQGIQAHYSIVNNSDRTLPDTFVSVHYSLPKTGHYKNENWSFKKLRLTKKITSLFKEDRAYIFVLGLGGTGTVLLYNLIPWLVEKRIKFKIIAGFPSHWEGERRAKTAEVLFSKMYGHPFFNCFRLDDLTEIKGETTVKEILQKSDEHFYTELTKLNLRNN